MPVDVPSFLAGEGFAQSAAIDRETSMQREFDNILAKRDQRLEEEIALGQREAEGHTKTLISLRALRLTFLDFINTMMELVPEHAPAIDLLARASIHKDDYRKSIGVEDLNESSCRHGAYLRALTSASLGKKLGYQYLMDLSGVIRNKYEEGNPKAGPPPKPVLEQTLIEAAKSLAPQFAKEKSDAENNIQKTRAALQVANKTTTSARYGLQQAQAAKSKAEQELKSAKEEAGWLSFLLPFSARRHKLLAAREQLEQADTQVQRAAAKMTKAEAASTEASRNVNRAVEELKKHTGGWEICGEPEVVKTEEKKEASPAPG